MTEKERALLRAAEDERRKRQALEAELAKARGAAPAQPGAEKKFWDDPDGALKTFEQKQAQRETTLVLNVTERLARARYSDFDEKLTKFSEMVQATPGLAQQWLASPDPAEFAYKTAKGHMEFQQYGSLDKMRAEIEAKARAEERAKVEAEFKARQEEAERKRAELPGSLSDVRGAATRQNAPVFNGPTPMTDILKH